MAVENGEWIMRGTTESDPNRLVTVDELRALVLEKGFVPLFAGDIPGISVEERTLGADWWSDDPARDPWMWRQILSEDENIAYGKFFGSKTGFISRDWFPCFANYRRDGYDFDSRWEDGLASYREKRLMDIFEEDAVRLSPDAKRLAGFGTGGEKNFEGTLTRLQMSTYLLMCGFGQRRNKRGEPYGWHVALLCTPEHRWGYGHVSSCYAEEPEASLARMVRHLLSVYPAMTEVQALRFLKG